MELKLRYKNESGDGGPPMQEVCLDVSNKDEARAVAFVRKPPEGTVLREAEVDGQIIPLYVVQK